MGASNGLNNQYDDNFQVFTTIFFALLSIPMSCLKPIVFLLRYTIFRY